MKAVFLSYNQALTDRVNAILDKQGIRGFTNGWALTEGRGSVDGEPHYGTHAWPSMNASILAIVDDEKVAPLMDAFREMDAATRMQGSRRLSGISKADSDSAACGAPCRTPLQRADGSYRVRSVRPSFTTSICPARTGIPVSSVPRYFGDRKPY